ncbi:MAG: hypothetical protein NW220_07400 [Leptolyngbyaceae cyanobacterium bins.349]|nr:hypothetical protein [Leptolyngbyaceae cyanobacterium bins.349]
MAIALASQLQIPLQQANQQFGTALTQVVQELQTLKASQLDLNQAVSLVLSLQDHEIEKTERIQNQVLKIQQSTPSKPMMSPINWTKQ